MNYSPSGGTINYVQLMFFIDLQKAFDSIDHSLLLQKRNRYDIRVTANSWLSSY